MMNDGMEVQVVADQPAQIVPADIVSKAREMAIILKGIVKDAGLARRIGPKEYLEYEAWLTIARFNMCTPVTKWTRAIERPGYEMTVDGRAWGYECLVEVHNANDQVIASAEGMCTRAESKWRGRDDYAIRSMAQTRTAGKALRSVFSWVVVLAGYAPTPAEEMDGVREEVERETDAGAITQPQKRKIFALCSEAGLKRDDAKALYDYAMQGDDGATKRRASAVIEDFGGILSAWRKQQKPGGGGDGPSVEPASIGGNTTPSGSSPSLPVLEKLLAGNAEITRADFDTATAICEIEISDMALSFVSRSDWRGAISQMVRELKGGES